MATELSHARVRYWSNFIDDRELTQDRKLKHLTKLKSAAEKLLKVLLDFEAKGRPGWLLLREGARLHARQIKEELHELRLKRQSLIEKKRESFGGQTDNQNLQALDAELNWHERAHFAYQDLGARGILYKAELAVEALVRWYDLPHQALTQKRIDELLKSPSDHPGHVKALRSLMVDLAEIYRNHFRREFSFSRPPSGGEPGGPAMRFAGAVFDEFEIKNEDGNSFSSEGIRRYWPTKS